MSKIEQLTIDELQALIDRAPQSRLKPLAFGHVSHTQFSIARYSGGCNYKGEHYTYIAAHDALIRADVLEWMVKEMGKEEPSSNGKAAKQAANQDNQLTLL